MWFYHPILPTLTINFCIIILLGILAYIAPNPLIVLGLFLLQPMPVVNTMSMVGGSTSEEDEEEGQPMGFTADVESRQK